MASVSLLGVTFNTTNGASGTPKTVTATPAVGDLILIIAAHSTNTTSAAPTDSQGGTYTNCETGGAGSGFTKNAADARGAIWVRDTAIPSATSTTFSHDPGTTSGGGIAVVKVTGMSRYGISAILQYADQATQLTGATPAPVFGATPQIGNPIVGMCFNGTNSSTTVTHRTGYTELVDQGYATPNNGLEVMALNSGETSATITWGSTVASPFGDAVVELDASAAGSVGADSAAATDTAAGVAAAISAGVSTDAIAAAAASQALAQAAGADASTATSTAIGVANAVSVGADASTETSSAVGVANALSVGADAAAAATTGTATAAGSIGADAASATSAAVGIAGALSQGADSATATDAAVGYSLAGAQGAAAAVEIDSATGFAPASADGSDSALASDTALGVAGALGVGSDSAAASSDAVGRDATGNVGEDTATATDAAVGLSAALGVGTAAAAGTSTAASFALVIANGSASALSISLGESAAGVSAVGNDSAAATASAVGFAIVPTPVPVNRTTSAPALMNGTVSPSRSRTTYAPQRAA